MLVQMSQGLEPQTSAKLFDSIPCGRGFLWLNGKECTCQVGEAWVPFLSQEDPLEKEEVTYSSILAWEPGD